MPRRFLKIYRLIVFGASNRFTIFHRLLGFRQEHKVGGIGLAGVALGHGAVPGDHLPAGLDILQRSSGVGAVSRNNGVLVCGDIQSARLSVI